MRATRQTTFFRELATMIEAGISPKDAIIKLKPKPVQQWAGTVQRLENGDTFFRSLPSSTTSRFEKEVIELSETAGRLNEGLRFLAESHENRQARLSSLRGRLLYPFFILVVAIVVSAVLSYVKFPEQGIFNVVSTAILWFVAALVVTRILINLMSQEGCVIIEKGYSWRASRWYQQLFQHLVFSSLLWQLKSGVDFKQGFLRTTRLFRHKALTQQLRMLANHCGKGGSVTDGVEVAGLPVTEDFLAILQSAEASGSWGSTLQHYLTNQADTIERRTALLYEWVPRFYYVWVVLIVVPVIF